MIKSIHIDLMIKSIYKDYTQKQKKNNEQHTYTYIFEREQKPEKSEQTEKSKPLHWNDLYVANLVIS